MFTRTSGVSGKDAQLIYDRAYDSITDRVWDSINKGVSLSTWKIRGRTRADEYGQRQWKDIRSRYVEAADDE